MLEVKHFFDGETFTLTYVAFDPATRDAVIIDPLLDYDQAASKTSDKSAQETIKFCLEKELSVHLILETHAHADHLSGAQVYKQAFPKALLCIGEKIITVQKTFAPVFGMLDWFQANGSQFDKLLKDREKITAGSLKIEAISTPGHTPGCSSYLIGDAVFTGDALFMPDSGTGRCDFPGGNAEFLYSSIAHQLYALPDATRVFTGHDYMPNGRPLRWESTISEEKQSNIHLKAATKKEDYVKFRQERDKTLKAPRLLLPSIQVNINAGKLPPVQKDGKHYLQIPIS